MKLASIFLLFNTFVFGIFLFRRIILNKGALFISFIRLHFVLNRLKPRDVVIDCGANIGDITLLFAKKNVSVFAFEPDPLAYKTLKKRTKGFPNIICLKKGVGIINKKVKMFFHRHRSHLNHEALSVSSTIIEEKRNINPENYVEIDIIDLTEFIDSLDSQVAMLKMDIEGAEIEILEKFIEQETYKKVDLLLVETHETKIPGHDEKVKRLKLLLAAKNIKNIKLNWI
jgi:FkbM family methyltransferase